jgi:hypothetical protein
LMSGACSGTHPGCVLLTAEFNLKPSITYCRLAIHMV